MIGHGNFIYMTEEKVQCEDCGKLYGATDWIDIVLSDDQWELLTGYSEGQGILCGGCITIRAAKMKDKNGICLFSVGKLTFYDLFGRAR